MARELTLIYFRGLHQARGLIARQIVYTNSSIKTRPNAEHQSSQRARAWCQPPSQTICVARKSLSAGIFLHVPYIVCSPLSIRICLVGRIKCMNFARLTSLSRDDGSR